VSPPMNTEDLKTLEAIHLKVVEASPDAKVVVNEVGLIVVFNQQAELLFGYDRSEVMGEGIEMLLPEDKRELHKSHRKTYFNSPKTREMGEGLLLQGRHRNGSLIPVQIKLAPFPVAGAGVHTLAVVRRVMEPRHAN